MSQEQYVERVLERFNMKNAKSVSTPLANHFKLSKRSCLTTDEEKKKMVVVPYSSAVESLMYVMVCIRPNIAHAVGVVSRFLSNPSKDYWEAVKWILRYLKGSLRICLCFGGPKPILDGYANADIVDDLDGRKSTFGFLFTFVENLSTTKVEYVAMTVAGKEMVWLKIFLQQLGMKHNMSIIHCDSQSSLDLNRNMMYHSYTKHIDVRYHWLRQAVEEQQFKLEKIHTNKNILLI